MPSPSEPTLILPPSLDEADVLRWAYAYAPLVCFDRAEVHFPSEPDVFMASARFRESIPEAPDRGWNGTENRWLVSDARSEEYFGVGWEVIATESRRLLPGSATLQPWQSGNVRPWDAGNVSHVAGRGTVWGLFLERDDRLDRGGSGSAPVGNGVRAPVFLDVAYDAPTRSLRFLYWFFYELNRWKWFLTHEGDWEHVSYLVRESAVVGLDPPSLVYFAQHNSGDVRPFRSLTPFEDGHRVVFVDKDGHPTNPHVRNRTDYTTEWRTWECPIRLIVKEAWRDYAGAWGEVGNLTDFTGPLGPLFKRGKDLVRIARRQGRLYVRSHKK